MTLRTLAMVAALWLACAASALAQTNIYNGTRDGGDSPQTGEDIGTGGGGDTPVNPGGGGGTGTDTPSGDYYDGADLYVACQSGVNNPENTYTLKKDVKRNARLEVYHNLTIDLNGHSITTNSDFCFTIAEGYTLTIIDSKPNGNIGSIIYSYGVGGDAIAIQSGGKLIADGVIITSGTGTAIHNNGGTVEITGCTVSGSIGIFNKGTTTVTGGSISGTYIAIESDGGTLSVNTGENPAACTISGGEFGIYNQFNGAVTISSSINFANCTISGIYNSGNSFTLNAWPTFNAANSAGVSDILLYNGEKITIGSAITAAPAKKISVRASDKNDNNLTAADLPATITSGYASHVIDGNSNVIDPADVFSFYDSSAGFAFALTGEGSSAEAQLVTAANAPVGTNITDALSPTASGDFNLDWEFEMPDYDVLVYFVYEDLFDPVTFAFAEGQEWMTWCSEASFTKPDGIDAYTIADATPEEITVTPITASDASQPAVLPAYTPLLLHKNGYDGLTAEQYAVPTAPTDDLFKDYGIVSHATTGCTLYGSTKAVAAAASSQIFALGRTYMLKSGEFVAVDQFDGIAANRCWLTLSGTPAASRLHIRSGESTEVSGVIEVNEVSDNTWYTITGRKIEKRPDRKGIYINNGKKVIIK